MKSGFFIRALASMLDNFISCFLISIILIPSYALPNWANIKKDFALREALSGGGDDIDIVMAYDSVWLMMLVSGVLFMLYSSLEIAFCRTPGKMILGLEVRHESGVHASTSALVKRVMFKSMPICITLIGAVFLSKHIVLLGGLTNLIVCYGFLMALGSAKQALHDRICHTAVFPCHAPYGDEVDYSQGRRMRLQNATSSDPNRPSKKAVDQLIFD